jgi:GT2 family glycosyltransferase
MTFRVGTEVVGSLPVPARDPVEMRIALTAGRVRPLVQNAGSVILPDGAGSDRGSIVVGTTAFYDTDHGQFDAVEDVPAFCGAAVLLRRSALEEVGSFDDSFFMYYEDTDLSLRLRRKGWRLVYTPEARVRHVHSATAVEWSPTFCYYTERNRLLMLLKNERAALFVKEWARYTARIFRAGETAENRKRFLLVQRSLLRHLPRAVAGRRGAHEAGAGSRLDFKDYSE